MAAERFPGGLAAVFLKPAGGPRGAGIDGRDLANPRGVSHDGRHDLDAVKIAAREKIAGDKLLLIPGHLPAIIVPLSG